jgi:general secretion pathway protein F
MGTFRYHSVGSAAGTIEAVDRASAVRELLSRGVTPTRIEPVESGASAAASAFSLNFRRSMSKPELATFVRELATAIQAGLPLINALRTIARQGRSKSQKAILTTIIEEVEQGRSLADAFDACDGAFGELIVNMVRAGEASGRLGDVLTQAAELLDREVKLRRAILSATLYPMILLLLIVIAIVIVVVKIVPDVIATIGTEIELPLPTRVVQGVADIIGGYWWVIVPAIVLSVLGARHWYLQPETRIRVDGFLLRVPVLGRLLRDVAVARFTRTLGTLTGAGVPVLQSLRITKGTLGNKAMESVVDEVTEQVSAGRTIADPMERSGYFPPMLVQIVNLGERSGRLDEMLDQAAGAFEDRTELSLKLFTTALPPILVVIMACAVGFVVLSILLPLLEMQEAAGM